jgi:hypothetical protein
LPSNAASIGVLRRVAVLLLLVFAALPASADAAVTRKKAIWGPITVDGVSQFPIYADLGVGIYQHALSWNAVAPARPANAQDPADPAYAWPPEVDQAVAEGARHGIQVSLMVTGTPGWANGGREPRYAPTEPDDYADFLAAAAKRYPAVRHWMIWGEPTKASNFRPLADDRLRPLRGSKLAGPKRYARMLDAAYAALKRVDRRNLVIGGNSFTVGTVTPLRWIQALKLPNGKPPRMDLYGHNPFSARRPDLSRPDLGSGYADFSDLDTLAGWVDRYLGRPRHTKPKLFLSEFTLPTDHANWEFNFHVTRGIQASWIGDALKIARRWSRIYTFGYLGLYDDAMRADGRQVERGLLERDGTPKPAYAAYRRG